MTNFDSVMVREAELADAERIARVHVESWRETYSGMLNDRYFSEEAFAHRAGFWARYLAMDPRPGQMSVAVHHGSIIGFANAGASVGPDAVHGFPVARSTTLFSIYLLAASHGAGIGRALLDAVVGQDPAQLWVLRGNARAIAFYRRNGFDFDDTEYADPADPNLVELRMGR
jgi:ribosomal protein S18 acetylase RimI-like enzyme